MAAFGMDTNRRKAGAVLRGPGFCSGPVQIYLLSMREAYTSKPGGQSEFPVEL